MAQNFWTAIDAFTVCLSRHHRCQPDDQAAARRRAGGLVLSPTGHATRKLAWYQRPAILGIIVLAATGLLNLVFF
jgi:hypothetical protein